MPIKEGSPLPQQTLKPRNMPMILPESLNRQKIVQTINREESVKRNLKVISLIKIKTC
jgi:hypothetical protein